MTSCIVQSALLDAHKQERHVVREHAVLDLGLQQQNITPVIINHLTIY